uniref:Peptidase M13 C-terminal domain-containing protein n=1 Tax=Stomoxys calcitrans TaxID=35570 RepID=A0A1I8NNW6_STOCA
MLLKITKVFVMITTLWSITQAASLGADEQRQRRQKSEEIRKYMNLSANPCNDFYEFACGNFARYNPTEIQVDIFSILEKEYEEKQVNVLTRESAGDTDMEKNVRNFYKSCLHIDLRMFKDKLKAIVQEFGKMPALEGNRWRENDFDWLKTIAEISHKYDVQLLMRYELGNDISDSSKRWLKLYWEDMQESLAALIIRSNHGITEQTVIASKLKTYLGLDQNTANRVAKDIADFKASLATACPASGVTVNAPTLTVDKMQRKYMPDVDVRRFLEISLGSNIPRNYKIEDHLATCHQNIVHTLKRTPKRTVANYVFYYLLKPFMMLQVPGQQQELCKIETTTHFASEMDFMAYRKEVSQQMENDLKHFWVTIKSTFQSILQSPRLSWIKDNTRKAALDKVRQMKLEFGQYERNMFSEKYSQLRLYRNDYLQNMRAILAYKAAEAHRKFNASSNPQQKVAEREGSPFTSRLKNTVIFPVSSLQPHYLWSGSLPNALKFGTLGFLASHELVHGFDDKGVFYDNNGQFKRWWDNLSFLSLHSRLDCFTEQYKRFNYMGESQSENIADNGGLRLAYEAYVKWYEDTLRFHQSVGEETLPRLNYNNRQLFFIAYGQMFCSNTRPELSTLDTSAFGHVPHKYRVNGPLSNLEEFSKEFNCPRGSNMNPSDKCVMY